MTIHLPADLESYIHAKVQSGQFPSEEAAVAEAVRRFRQSELEQAGSSNPPANDIAPADPLLGCMKFDAELMDEIVADAYHQRRTEPWREFDL
jgi:Arc/MetJ-type ribon-helix-helix transcriptional regulator